MQRQFEIEIEQIKQTVLTMAGLAEKSLEDVSRALIERDSDLARAVIDLDDEIDRHEVLIDQLTAEFIVRHQPTAVDLRFVLVAIKLGPGARADRGQRGQHRPAGAPPQRAAAGQAAHRPAADARGGAGHGQRLDLRFRRPRHRPGA